MESELLSVCLGMPNVISIPYNNNRSKRPLFRVADDVTCNLYVILTLDDSNNHDRRNPSETPRLIHYPLCIGMLILKIVTVSRDK